MRSMVKLASSTVSEYLVGQGLVGDERAKLKESAIIKRSSLMDEIQYSIYISYIYWVFNHF